MSYLSFMLSYAACLPLTVSGLAPGASVTAGEILNIRMSSELLKAATHARHYVRPARRADLNLNSACLRNAASFRLAQLPRVSGSCRIGPDTGQSFVEIKFRKQSSCPDD